MSTEDKSAAISAAGDAEAAWTWAQSYLVAEELTDDGPDAVAHIRAARLVLMKLFDAWEEAKDKAGITDFDDCIASFQAMCPARSFRCIGRSPVEATAKDQRAADKLFCGDGPL